MLPTKKIKSFDANTTKWFEKNLKNTKFYIRTYGCQGNIIDSQTISGILKKFKLKETNNYLDAKIIILNTCAVRENAIEKVQGFIGLLKKHIVNKDRYLGLCGCICQDQKTIDHLVKTFPFISFIIGTNNLSQLPNAIADAISNQKIVCHTNLVNSDLVEDLPNDRTNDRYKAFVNIMQGCDKFCTYCIIPYTRGRIRCRSAIAILNEIKELYHNGYKEVTLVGTNVNSYRDKKIGFIELLEKVCKTKIARVRFVTSNPWNFDLKIVDLCKKYSNLMPYFHLPIQSGDETILAKMNRKMKINDYLKIINYIKSNIHDCAISTDLIVGFPNETNEQFENTLKLYKKIEFDNAYTFIYSKRNNTPAAKIIDKTKIATKKIRLEKLNEMVRFYAKKNNEKFLNKILDVLVDGKSRTNAKNLTGYSPQWKVVDFIGKAKIGEIVKVKITSISRFSLGGKQVF